MITKFNLYTESLLNKIEGPSKEDVWKNLGYDKSYETPEDFILDILNNMKVKEQTKYSESCFWEKDGKIVMEQNFEDNELYIDFYIFELMERVFIDIPYDNIKEMIKKRLLWKNFNIIRWFWEDDYFE